MGTRKGFPGWVPYEDSAPPLLSRSRFQEGKVIGHAEGPRPGEPPVSYGAVDRSIKDGTRFGKIPR